MVRKQALQRKTCGYIIITAVFILVAALSIAGTVHSKERDIYALNNPSIVKEEKQCKKLIKKALEEYQCKNSGITMTKVIDIKGNRQYLVMIHHDKINTMTESKKEELKKVLENIGFSKENYTISYEFLP